MKIGERLYNLRTKQGVYQKELAAYLNLSVSAISSYENDKHLPDIKTLGKMAEFFTCRWIICWALLIILPP